MDLQNVNENRELFVKYMGQTSDYPLGIEIDRAKGVYLYDKEGNAYMDLISGLSVNNLGHCHPKIVKAIREQAEKYLHVMVYGEFVQSPQVELATLLQSVLPPSLCSSFFVNSGSEAVEGALKLAKKFTGRTEIMGFKNAYHGSTHGAFSLIGNELFRNAFRPLLPDVKHLTFNDFEELRKITSRTACVVVEPIQAEAGIVEPQNDFLKALGKRCKETGTLLVFDEVQTGFGRTGSLFAFEQFGVVPDILVLGKALGGGMPVAAFVSSREIMSSLKKEPVLGHITTFGGHPICCASAIASLSTLLKEDIVDGVQEKGDLFYRNLIDHPEVIEISGRGLFRSVKLKSRIQVKKLLPRLLQKGILSNSFIFLFDRFRIAPPLIISEQEINKASDIILEVLDELSHEK